MKAKSTYDVNMDCSISSIVGTSLKGYFPEGTAYNDLQIVFGSPNGRSRSKEWIGKINGHVFHIYDYYLEGRWHIGGKCPEVADMLVEYFKITLAAKQVNIQRPSVIRKLLIRKEV